ncbi:hypothetical protein RFI_23885 [Reticulomyxa filosa]|uniref:SAM domain-containing protein n=1 Tax=Reticulomyxa filosa TaxID=46433 RepID=X6MJ80_RETFI|nr:hypothetical protein RFI_23885 [Reticulomyxa filosa]|eukprot:ETO13487.1 hypothetical protein RFI_23885 [Reticulomyxa filosa]
MTVIFTYQFFLFKAESLRAQENKTFLKVKFELLHLFRFDRYPKSPMLCGTYMNPPLLSFCGDGIRNDKSEEMPKNQRRKLEFTAEKLRQQMLVWAFTKTGKVFQKDKVKRLGAEHSEEKLQRYNYLCPKCHVIDLIHKEGYETIGSIPLCIDTCDNSPFQNYSLDNEMEWAHIKHQNFEDVSAKLNQFVSVYVQRNKMNVVENTVLMLQIRLTTSTKGGDILDLCNSQWVIKVLKRLWFEKIRTSTVIIYFQNFIYLFFPSFCSTRVHNEKKEPGSFHFENGGSFFYVQREFQHIPIDSVIGATIDSSMQICLALQSSYESNTNKNGHPRRVSFDLYFNRDFLRTTESPIDVKITIQKSHCRQTHHSKLTRFTSRSIEWQDGIVTAMEDSCENSDKDTFSLYSFKIDSSGFQNTHTEGTPFVVVQASAKNDPTVSVFSLFLKNPFAHIPFNDEKQRINKRVGTTQQVVDLKKTQIRKTAKEKTKNKREEENIRSISRKRKKSESLGIIEYPSKRQKENNKVMSLNDQELQILPLSIAEESQAFLVPSLLADHPGTSVIEFPAIIQHTNTTLETVKENDCKTEEIKKEQEKKQSDSALKSCSLDATISTYHQNQNSRDYALKELCVAIKIPHFYEKVKKVGCTTPEDVSAVFQDETKVNAILSQYCTDPFEQLAMISMVRLCIKDFMLSEKNFQRPSDSSPKATIDFEFSKDLSQLRSSLPFCPNETAQELNNILHEETWFGQCHETRYEEIRERVQQKQTVFATKTLWQTFLQQWKKWTIEDFQAYLTRIERHRFSKYFCSLEQLRQLWKSCNSIDFVGHCLEQINGKQLEELGVSDNNDRAMLCECLKALTQNALSANLNCFCTK